MADGILNLYKEQGMTSQDAVAILRRVFGQKRIGHTGTLDPAVTGVLPICLGRATRLADYISAQGKRYEGVFRLGLRTDTLDLTGEVLERRDVTKPDLATVQEAAQAFTGEIWQKPPMYSAVKVQGRRLYDLARQGKEVERKARKILIGDLTIQDLPGNDFAFTCTCSKGTYIRQLVDDLGEALGTLAVLVQLERIQVGPYKLEEAVPISRMRDMTRAEALTYLQPMDRALPNLPALYVPPQAGLTLFYGQRLPKSQARLAPPETKSIYSDFVAGEAEPPYRLYVDQTFAGLARIEGKAIHLYRGLVDIQEIQALVDQQ